ncbi:hypothetical protein AALP_AA6G241800 [Arabis alpina]|uniref:Uncharacterized protein n=1 Tax=Arabis alpina TaxID=50452 RepID=A0A087GRD8_ARAAL|nr:hypothetical protein AALP_AA6G241800 [Arabis alpina]
MFRFRFRPILFQIVFGFVDVFFSFLWIDLYSGC